MNIHFYHRHGRKRSCIISADWRRVSRASTRKFWPLKRLFVALLEGWGTWPTKTAETPYFHSNETPASVVVDCFEIFNPTTFEEQDDVNPIRKYYYTLDVLVGTAPNGAIIFVLDAYEGAISDTRFEKSKLIDLLRPRDWVMAAGSSLKFCLLCVVAIKLQQLMKYSNFIMTSW